MSKRTRRASERNPRSGTGLKPEPYVSPPEHAGGGRGARRAANAGLILVILGSITYLLLPSMRWKDKPGERSGDNTHTPSAHKTPDPTLEGGPPWIEPAYELADDGRQGPRIDMDRVAKWCKARGLPAPPRIRQLDPAVVDTLMEALRAVTTERSGETLGRLGRICASLEGRQSAEQYFLLAADTDPGDFRWPYHLGCLYQDTGRDKEAVEVLTTARHLNPDYPLVYARLGQLYLQGGADEKAANMWRRYAEMRPEDWLGYVGLGRMALRRKDYEAALPLLEEAVERGPGDFQAHYYLARAHVGLGQDEPALRHFAISRDLPQGHWFRMHDPLDQELHRASGSVQELVLQFEQLRTGRDWARLVALAEEIIRRRDGDTAMMGNLASLYRKLKRFNEAHAILDRAQEIKPDSPRIKTLRAETFLAESRLQEALAATDTVLAIDPQHGRAHAVRGRALLLLKRYAEAEAAMRQAIALDAANAANQYVLCEILLARGDLNIAAQCLERLLEHHPNYRPAQQRLARIRE